MSEGGNVAGGPRNRPKQVGPAPWLAPACLVGLFLAYAVLTNFTAELRAALWGEPGTVTEADCRTYDNTVANAGTSTSCSGTFTPDDGGSSFDVLVAGDIDSQPVRAWLVDGTSGTAYISPTVWAGVLPVGLAFLLAGLPAAVTVTRVRRVHATSWRAPSRISPRFECVIGDEHDGYSEQSPGSTSTGRACGRGGWPRPGAQLPPCAPQRRRLPQVVRHLRCSAPQVGHSAIN